MLEGCYLENFSYFSTRNADVLSLSKLENIFFPPSSFIHLSVSLITFLLKNGLNMYIDVLCFVIWRALTRE
jgi:hypothetical protein